MLLRYLAPDTAFLTELDLIACNICKQCPMGEDANDMTSRRESAPSLKARRAVATTRPPRPDDGTMAAPTTQLKTTGSEYGTDADVGSIAALSDYGSDIGFDIDDDTILADALHTINSARPAEKTAVLPSIEFEEGEREDEAEEYVDGFVQVHRPTVLHVARGKRKNADAMDVQNSPLRERTVLEVEYDERSRRVWSGASRTAAGSQHL
jgi:exonuclease V